MGKARDLFKKTGDTKGTFHAKIDRNGKDLIETERSLRPVLYSSVYSFHHFLISSASVRSLSFLSFIVPILAQNVPLISPVFLKRCLDFPILLFSLFLCIVHLRSPSYLSLLFSGTLHSDWYIFPFLLGLSLLFFSQLLMVNHSFS